MVAQAKGFMKDQVFICISLKRKGAQTFVESLLQDRWDMLWEIHLTLWSFLEKAVRQKFLWQLTTAVLMQISLSRRNFMIRATPRSKKLSELKKNDGSKPVIAATRIGSGTYIYGTYVLQQYGVNDKFQWIGGGGSKTMLGGFGKFDAIMAVPAWQFVAEDDGYGKAIYDVASLETWNEAFGGAIPTTIVYVWKTPYWIIQR